MFFQVPLVLSISIVRMEFCQHGNTVAGTGAVQQGSLYSSAMSLLQQTFRCQRVGLKEGVYQCILARTTLLEPQEA